MVLHIVQSRPRSQQEKEISFICALIPIATPSPSSHNVNFHTNTSGRRWKGTIIRGPCGTMMRRLTNGGTALMMVSILRESPTAFRDFIKSNVSSLFFGFGSAEMHDLMTVICSDVYSMVRGQSSLQHCLTQIKHVRQWIDLRNLSFVANIGF